jgi:hypothetical protein
MIFLAIIKILDIHVGSTNEQTIYANLIHEPNVQLRSQIMHFVITDASYQLDTPDWEWTGLMEPGAAMSGLREIEGNHVDLIDAALCSCT